MIYLFIFIFFKRHRFLVLVGRTTELMLGVYDIFQKGDVAKRDFLLPQTYGVN
jgi:hypothetical protein